MKLASILLVGHLPFSLVFPSICLSCLFVSSVSQSGLSVCLSFWSVYLYFCLSVRSLGLSICLSVCSLCPSCLPVSLIRLSVCLVLLSLFLVCISCLVCLCLALWSITDQKRTDIQKKRQTEGLDRKID